MKKDTREFLPWSYPLAAFSVIAVLLFIYLSQYAQLVRTQYSLVERKAVQQKLHREQANLELQIQELSSLERVERIATARLKMAPPVQRQVLDLAAWEKGRKQAAQAGTERAAQRPATARTEQVAVR
jgi:cell division protein FtsL